MPNRNRSFPVLIGATLSLVLAGCAGPAGSGDVATVNGVKLSRADYLTKLESTQQAKGVLNQMVQSSLVDQYAKDHAITIADSDVQKKEDEIKARYPAGQFDGILKQQNLTEDDVKRILRQQLTIEKAVSKDIHIAQSDIKAYLDKNHTTLDKPEQVRARHILVADEKTAQLVETQLKAGGKFEALAKQYSTDPSSKDKGGELGFFSKGQMVPAFESAAFTQPLKVVGPPVKSPFGYHIIEVEEKKPPMIATPQNSGDQVKETLMHQQEQTLIPTFMQNLRRQATITIEDPLLKDALPPLPPEQPTASPTATATAAPTTAATTSAPATPVPTK
jgi:foldase protein PrsA